MRRGAPQVCKLPKSLKFTSLVTAILRLFVWLGMNRFDSGNMSEVATGGKGQICSGQPYSCKMILDSYTIESEACQLSSARFKINL